METSGNSSTPRPRLHPLVATAAISVIVLSAVGVTALVMNRSNATPSPYDAPASTAPAAALPLAQVEAPALRSAEPAPVSHIAASTPMPVQPAAPNYGPNYAPTNGPAAPAAVPTYNAPPPVVQAPAVCRDCGVVDSIHEFKVKGEGTGVGAVGGAVVGGLLGNMVGAGRGKALATVAGAVGGGLGGNAIEKNVRGSVQHRMVVRLENGTTRTFTQVDPFPYGIGERVHIVHGHVERG